MVRRTGLLLFLMLFCTIKCQDSKNETFLDVLTRFGRIFVPDSTQYNTSLSSTTLSSTTLRSTTLSGTTASDTTLSDTTTLPSLTFKDEEKAIVDYVNSLLRMILPHVVGGSGAAKLTPRCTSSMMKIFANLRKLKGWTLKMLDSMGKPTSGVLEGNSYSMGNYDECLDISVTSRGYETTNSEEEMFRGQYCRIRMQPPDAVVETAMDYNRGRIELSQLGKLKDLIQAIPYVPATPNYMRHFLGLCLPSLCTLADVSELAKALPFPGSAVAERCDTKVVVDVDYEQTVVIGMFSFLAVMGLLGTLVDYLLQLTSEQTSTQYRSSKCVSVVVSFSFCANTKKLMKRVENDDEEIPNGHSIRGLITGTIFCLILCHSYFSPFDAFYKQASNTSNLKNYFSQQHFALMVCLSLTIETLFVCYGFLLSYPLWQSAWKKEDVKVNVLKIISKRYIQLCLPLLFCIGIVVLLPLFGSGPFWADIMESSLQSCKNSWGIHLGMYANFLDVEEQCLPHLWFVSCLMQITILSAFIAWILSRWPKFGTWILIFTVIGCNAAVGVLTYKKDFPPTYVQYFRETKSSLFWKINYSLPLSHIGSFAVGMLLGILVAKRTHLKLHRVIIAIGWTVSVGIIIGLMLAIYPYRGNVRMTPTLAAVYAAAHRTLFSAAVAWIILICSYGQGGFINSILSCRVLDPLYKLSYFAYLLHFVVISFHIGVAREHFSYSHVELIMRALAYICISYAAAYVCYMISEMPLRSLQSAFCPSKSQELDIMPFMNGKKQSDILQSFRNNKQNTCHMWTITESEKEVGLQRNKISSM